jgi:Cu(I)/Ag(I) efflux system periplasmic protein CusF
MTTPFRSLFALVGLAGSLLAGTVQAQSSEAEVRKIDRAQGKITLRHGEIKNLEMPPMTMVFRVADAKLLDGLAEGAKVRFDAEKINGQYTVVRIAPAP